VIYRWDGYEVDTQLYEVRRHGAPVKLEPRVYDVLAFLVAHRERVVPLRELRDALWPGEFVTDSAVTRCIGEARRALGDTGDEQRVIRTIHGRGYRFVAEATDAAEPIQPAVAEPAVATAVVAAPSNQRRRTLTIALVACAVVVAVVAIVGQRVRSSNAVPRRTLVIAPQVSDAADADLQLLALSVADLLEKRLSSVPGLVLRPPDYGAIGHGRAETSTEGATHVLDAALRRSEDGLKGQVVVTLRDVVSQPARATPLGVYDLPFLGPATDLTMFTRVRDAIASRLLNVLLPAIDMPGADSARPRDPRAFRLYLLAASRIAQTVICDQAALELVKQSLELDPSYAPGWVLLGWAHDNQATACGQQGSHYDAAMEAATRAAELAPDLPASYPLRSAILAETGRVEEAYEIARDALRRFPEAPDVRYAQVYVLTYAGFTEEARRQLERVLELDPSYLTAGGWTPNVLMYEREWDRFLALLPATSTPLFRFYRGYALLQQGRNADARKQVAPSFRQNPHDVFARFGQALTAIVDGQPKEAVEQIRQLSRQRVELGSRDGEVTYKQAQLLALAGDREGSLDELDRAVEQGFFCTPCFAQDPAMEPLGALPRFREIFARAQRRHDEFGARFRPDATTTP
jgi:DNA-binding winged helix-turn-helix (wHTH) protein/tetratricopeptide (TPR) repeat protein